MITEDYVSFEIANLLKEKGFDCECSGYYDQLRLLQRLSACSIKDTLMSPFYFDCIPAPTLQMAMKWLREVHNLHIMVNCIGKVNYDPVVQKFDGKDFEIDGVKVGATKYINGKWINVRRGFKTYEIACEAAIKYCIEHLI